MSHQKVSFFTNSLCKLQKNKWLEGHCYYLFLFFFLILPFFLISFSSPHYFLSSCYYYNPTTNSSTFWNKELKEKNSLRNSYLPTYNELFSCKSPSGNSSKEKCFRTKIKYMLPARLALATWNINWTILMCKRPHSCSSLVFNFCL